MYELEVVRTEQFRGLDLGAEIEITCRVRVIGLNQELVDVTSYGASEIPVLLPSTERITFQATNIQRKF